MTSIFGLLIVGYIVILILDYIFQFFANKLKEVKKEAIEKTIYEKLNGEFVKAKNELALAQKFKAETIQLAKERQIGFPLLAKAYDEYFKLQDGQIETYLINKKHPAYKAAEVLSEYNRIKRIALKDKRISDYIIEYYESTCPFLLDLKEELDLPKEEDLKLLEEYSPEEKEDEVINYLTIEEYRKLPSIERNQMALDRFKNRKWSKWLIGRMYERYVGYLYEQKGYGVDYIGIFRGYEDLGRDLICSNEKEIIIIQCKCWSQFKTIYEKYIFQFFGTVFEYRDKNPNQNVRALFYTSTRLSELANRFAKELNIELKENFPLNNAYPCIKCNVSRASREKIYHLPFDQQYDKVKIEPQRGEFYCSTVTEAEKKGFRRAFRYRGEASNE